MKPIIEPWQSRGLCAGMDDAWHQIPAADAKETCQWCPVKATCLEEAMRLERGVKGARWHIWGGLDPDEREQLERVNHTACVTCGGPTKTRGTTGMCGKCVHHRKRGPRPIIVLTCVTCGINYEGTRGVYCPTCTTERNRIGRNASRQRSRERARERKNAQ